MMRLSLITLAILAAFSLSVPAQQFPLTPLQPSDYGYQDTSLLTITNSSWKMKDGNVYIQGTVVNPTEYAVSNVLVEFQGTDGSGYPVANSTYSVALVQGKSTASFSFETIAGGRVEKGSLDIVGTARMP